MPTVSGPNHQPGRRRSTPAIQPLYRHLAENPRYPWRKRPGRISSKPYLLSSMPYIGPPKAGSGSFPASRLRLPDIAVPGGQKMACPASHARNGAVGSPCQMAATPVPTAGLHRGSLCGKFMRSPRHGARPHDEDGIAWKNSPGTTGPKNMKPMRGQEGIASQPPGARPGPPAGDSCRCSLVCPRPPARCCRGRSREQHMRNE